MAIQFFDQKSDYLHCGSPDDPRLFHADPSDQIQVWSPQVGQGYMQTISLREGLSLVILDYSIHSAFSRKATRRSPFLEFEFQVEGPAAGQSAFVPKVIQPDSFGLRPVQPRQLNVEVIFSAPLLKPYAYAVIEHLPPQDRSTLYDLANWVYRSQYGYAARSPQAAFDYVLSGAIASSQASTVGNPFEHLEFFAMGRLWRSMTSEMYKVIEQILGCPHIGHTRRTYLEEKALKLVALMLQGLSHSDVVSCSLVGDDLDRIYQAGRILACNLYNPPSIETLSRQVGLNRLKLNQGFYQVYGTTPFRYLRHCRLNMAEHLLTTSDLDVEVVAHNVGYTSRSNFARAFRQWFGLNPKALQLYNRYVPELQGYAG